MDIEILVNADFALIRAVTLLTALSHGRVIESGSLVDAIAEIHLAQEALHKALREPSDVPADPQLGSYH
jgi:hypothetical protein